MPQDDDIKTIHKALQYLAGICDGAQARDGQGYNAFDAQWGHELAMRPELSYAQAASALKQLRKYTVQLDNAGIVLPDRLEPEPIRRKVTLAGSRIEVRFSEIPPADLRQRMKAIQGWSYSEGVWSFPSQQAAALSKVIPEAAEIEVPAEEIPASPAVQPAANPDVMLRTNGMIEVVFGRGSPYFQQNLTFVKGLTERRYDPDKKLWKVPNRLADQLVKGLAGKIEMNEDVRRLVATHRELAGMSGKATGSFEVPGLKGELFPFQKTGVEFIEKAGRVLIADQMGLGKTIQAIGYLQLHPELRPALIVVPAAVKINWKREIERWMSTPETVRILSGQTPDTLGSGMLSSPTIYICNYDILTYWEDHLKSVQPQVMIVDEGHYCKNPKALRTRSVQSLAKQINKLIILTGTPIINRPNELFPLLQMIDPKSWPNFFRYALQYCDAHSNGFGWDFSGASNLEELHQVTRPYIVRRTKSQVLKELPPKRRAVINIEFDARIWDEYSNYVLEAAHSAGPAEALVWIEKSKQAAAKGKLPAAMNWIEDFLGTGEKLVVFCTHNLTVDALMGKFGSQAVKVTGDVTGQARQDAVDRFQNDPQVRLFVGNIKAAGIGITLTAASDVAFLEFGWTPEEMDQAEDRLHRIGQIDSVTCWYICADGTIDNDIVELLESKRVAVDIVTDGKVGDMQFSIERELWERVLVNHAE